ncbi:protein kinase domain-containing protein [Lyngbya confervoides]|uniref:non-specific serine/threonine protein kinase n=1 Tax=Lyngbya confervoides BDU141951 TaxID=1574623 RepID=A0ABD4T0M4_9CYAN|nr:RDD family protein [Lyngbya confervoides]MCM1981852.1 RDD family protein [Lyngbya confervoides BDU141951]
MSLCINPQCQRPQNSDQTSFCQTCGSELVLAGQYRVLGELGSGGFGKTYEISADPSALPKVLKVLINPMPKAVELFKREAEVLALLRHPGIPHVDAGEYFVFWPRGSEDPLHCLIMEKIEGLNLQDYMHQRGNRPVQQKLVLEWLIEVVKILDIVHSQHFFHRDIKPSNIMLRNDGHLALIDFGTAREVTGTYVAKQEAGGVTGIISTGYTPPEQLNGQAVQQSDFYALGRTMVYLLTAQEPSDIYQPTTDEFPWDTHAPHIHPDFADLLNQMMTRIPKYRPPNTGSLLDSLMRIRQFIITQGSASPSGSVGSGPQGIGPNSGPTSDPGSGPSSTPFSHATAYPNGAGGAYPRSTPGSAPPWPQPGLGAQPESSPYPASPYPAGYGGASVYANFGKRFIALWIDLFLIAVVLLILSFIVGVLTEGVHNEGVGYAMGYALGILILTVLPIMTWLYYALQESSAAMGTFGHRAANLQVTDLSFQRITFGRATLRFTAKLLSAVSIVGYPLALFTERRQALHDLIAMTLMIDRQSRLN